MTMMPPESAQPSSSKKHHPMAPPYVDDDSDRALVEMGLRIAENEKRDAVTDLYERAALSSENPQEALDDIDYTNTDDLTDSQQ